ncbi:hypothetical protein E1B28_001303 [Marasmius oreades]|uniref:Copper transport protein n=1 Tax=Marasmius oreades TaxID=181124 RepID=A0A9P7V399_9AGAR|nr:uncharacterized protein E1B28_001303 [Marasmius oreades]KAG7099452.1 hypothetical protein E1B28_001303 [Marasmius oreades]
MDMGQGSSGGISMMSMMTPWLHFNSSSDTLLLQSWQPKSSGAIAGACIGLVVVCLLERWLSGIRAVMEAYWRNRILVITGTEKKNESSEASSEKCCASGPVIDSVEEQSSKPLRTTTFSRTLPPFILTHDIPRGLLYAVQALLGYILMLSVMTFQAAYIISIILGMGAGEMLFGRMGNIGGHGILH